MIDTTVTNCGNEGDVTGVNNLGGLCYELYGGTMTGCYNTGRVTATGTYVGGLMGYAKQTTVTNVYNTGDVSTEKTLVGGLIGVMEKSSADKCLHDRQGHDSRGQRRDRRSRGQCGSGLQCVLPRRRFRDWRRERHGEDRRGAEGAGTDARQQLQGEYRLRRLSAAGMAGGPRTSV
ncbi:MAG: GLUG motif-containing protein [Oscillospiraceae bacterium]